VILQTSPTATTRLYLQDSRCFENEARVVGVRENAIAFDRSCFYPGGGGQPPDEGSVGLQSGEVLEILSAQADPNDVVWHVIPSRPPPAIIGQPARLMLTKLCEIV
jgi:misacylated tRNA(Ala) deacylase